MPAAASHPLLPSHASSIGQHIDASRSWPSKTSLPLPRGIPTLHARACPRRCRPAGYEDWNGPRPRTYLDARPQPDLTARTLCSGISEQGLGPAAGGHNSAHVMHRGKAPRRKKTKLSIQPIMRPNRKHHHGFGACVKFQRLISSARPVPQREPPDRPTARRAWPRKSRSL